MERCVNAGLRANQAVIANGDGVVIQQNHAVVDEDIVADVNVDAVITHEGRFDPAVLAIVSEEFLKDRGTDIKVVHALSVVAAQQAAGTTIKRNEFRIAGVVLLAGEHLFSFRHGLFLRTRRDWLI